MTDFLNIGSFSDIIIVKNIENDNLYVMKIFNKNEIGKIFY